MVGWVKDLPVMSLIMLSLSLASLNLSFTHGYCTVSILPLDGHSYQLQSSISARRLIVAAQQDTVEMFQGQTKVIALQKQPVVRYILMSTVRISVVVTAEKEK